MVAGDAQIHPTASIGPHAVVGARTVVGPRSVVHANVVLYTDVQIGADCELHASVVVREECEIGDRVILHPGVSIGADGFGYAFDENGRPAKIPQVGRVVIEDDVEIGALAAVDRATLGVTAHLRATPRSTISASSRTTATSEKTSSIVGLSGLAGSTIVGQGRDPDGTDGDHRAPARRRTRLSRRPCRGPQGRATPASTCGARRRWSNVRGTRAWPRSGGCPRRCAGCAPSNARSGSRNERDEDDA